jgi:thiamine phosphate phosphatase / amino-HMP aminohydrolase
MDPEGKGTGLISKGDESGMCTGYDKLREMKKVIAEHSSSHPFTTVYVGDSDTDLPCLLYADIGIVMGDGASVIETCNRVGIQLRSHPLLGEMHPKREKQGVTLYRLDNWHGIAQSRLLE